MAKMEWQEKINLTGKKVEEYKDAFPNEYKEGEEL